MRAGKSRWKFYLCWTVKLYMRHTENPRLIPWKKLLPCYSTLLFLNTHCTLDFANLPPFALRLLCLHWTDPSFSKIASNSAFNVSSSVTSISCVFPTRAPNWIKGMTVLQKDQKIVSRKSTGETWTLILLNSVSPLRNYPASPKTCSVPQAQPAMVSKNPKPFFLPWGSKKAGSIWAALCSSLAQDILSLASSVVVGKFFSRKHSLLEKLRCPPHDFK